MLQTIIAAAPSDVAQISSRRSGSDTTGDAATSSSVTSLRNRAYGFSRPCRAFFTLTAAKSSWVAPCSSMRRRGVEPEVRGVGRAEQPEAEPVGVVAPLARVRREEALGRGVGADDQRDVDEPGEDLRPRRRERGHTARARGVATTTPPRPASPAPGRTSRRRRSPGSRCARCRRRRRAARRASRRPASASAACAATTPYSTKFLPHLPQGCIPTPRTAISGVAAHDATGFHCQTTYSCSSSA